MEGEHGEDTGTSDGRDPSRTESFLEEGLLEEGLLEEGLLEEGSLEEGSLEEEESQSSTGGTGSKDPEGSEGGVSIGEK